MKTAIVVYFNFRLNGYQQDVETPSQYKDTNTWIKLKSEGIFSLFIHVYEIDFLSLRSEMTHCFQISIVNPVQSFCPDVCILV